MSALIEWRDGKAAIQGIAVEQLAAEFGTPLYVYDEQILLEQFELLRKALPASIEIYYSIKANPHPNIISVFVRCGAGCEISSGGEYVLARRAGASHERIVFAGPGKGREELEYVISQGIGEIHVESFEEIEILEGIAAHFDTIVRISIRVNPSAASGGGLLMGGQPTAFGFEEESLPRVLDALRLCAHLRIQGVHLYTGTQILVASSLVTHWRYAIEVAKSTADLTGEPISTVDLGGGLGIPYFAHEKELDLEVLRSGAQILIDEANADPRLKNARFIVEPGRFLAGPAGLYVASVRSVKACRGTTFVVLDGGMNHHLAASGNLGQVVRRDYPIVNLSRNHGAPESTFVVVGPLCTPIDTLGRKVKMTLPRQGDLLGILQSGAYGLTASPLQFLSHPTPAEVMISSGAQEVITPRKSLFERPGEGAWQRHDGSQYFCGGSNLTGDASGKPLNRISNLSVDVFISEYLQKNRPVVITGAMSDWKALNSWTPEVLANRFGNERVQIYGDLFRLAGITSLSEYLQRYFGKDSQETNSVPYVRWYCHLANDERVPWADDVFAKFRDDWSRPAFFPASSFVLPYCVASDNIDPSRDWFPARGLFISARGARTRLHVDPWCSDALLCQIFGEKDFVMYHPSQAPYLVSNGKTVDVEAPDRQAFPDFERARPTVQDTLHPGEIVLVPSGWFHHFNSISDSISLTWNFVHICRGREFVSYLVRGPAESELKQLSYAYFESPSARKASLTEL